MSVRRRSTAAAVRIVRIPGETPWSAALAATCSRLEAHEGRNETARPRRPRIVRDLQHVRTVTRAAARDAPNRSRLGTREAPRWRHDRTSSRSRIRSRRIRIRHRVGRGRRPRVESRRLRRAHCRPHETPRGRDARRIWTWRTDGERARRSIRPRRKTGAPRPGPRPNRVARRRAEPRRRHRRWTLGDRSCASCAARSCCRNRRVGFSGLVRK